MVLALYIEEVKRNTIAGGAPHANGSKDVVYRVRLAYGKITRSLATFDTKARAEQYRDTWKPEYM